MGAAGAGARGGVEHNSQEERHSGGKGDLGRLVLREAPGQMVIGENCKWT